MNLDALNQNMAPIPSKGLAHRVAQALLASDHDMSAAEVQNVVISQMHYQADFESVERCLKHLAWQGSVIETDLLKYRWATLDEYRERRAEMKAKKEAGREPKESKTSRRGYTKTGDRTESVGVSLTVDEKLWLMEEGERLNLAMAEICRRKIFGDDLPEGEPVKRGFGVDVLCFAFATGAFAGAVTVFMALWA